MLSRFSSAARSRRTTRPGAESLETRSLLSGLSPTAIEQLYLEQLDDARFNPAAYGQSLGLDLSNVAPSPPLAMNASLVESARLHSQDMIAQNYFSHTSPQGLGPGQRIQAAGLNPTGYAESIETDTNPISSSAASYAAWDTGFSLSNLIVDQGIPDLGHRVMLLDIGGQLLNERQVGIGIASQYSSSGGFSYVQTDTTIDIAATTNTNPFLTGVVFNDSAGKGEYHPGEGLGGVTISVSNGNTTTTLDAGGYSMQVTPGIYTVTASGGGLPAPIARTVVVGNNNVRLNFVENANGTLLNAGSGGLVNGQLGSFTPSQAGDSASGYSVRIDWGDGNVSTGTLTPNPNGTFEVSGSNVYTNNGVYAVRVLATHLSDGQSVALNATVAVGNGAGGGSTQGGSGNGGTATGPSGGVINPIEGKASHQKKHHPKPAAKPHRHPRPIMRKSPKVHPLQGQKKHI